MGVTYAPDGSTWFRCGIRSLLAFPLTSAAPVARSSLPRILSANTSSALNAVNAPNCPSRLCPRFFTRAYPHVLPAMETFFLSAACRPSRTRIYAYRKNFDKHVGGGLDGKYVGLDFGQLRLLSNTDRMLRDLLLVMTLDVEHFAKVRLLALAEDHGEDGYGVLRDYLASASRNQRSYIQSENVHAVLSIRPHGARGYRALRARGGAGRAVPLFPQNGFVRSRGEPSGGLARLPGAFDARTGSATLGAYNKTLRGFRRAGLRKRFCPDFFSPLSLQGRHRIGAVPCRFVRQAPGIKRLQDALGLAKARAQILCRLFGS